MHPCIHASNHVRTHTSIHAFMHAFMHLCIHKRMHVQMHSWRCSDMFYTCFRLLPGLVHACFRHVPGMLHMWVRHFSKRFRCIHSIILLLGSQKWTPLSRIWNRVAVSSREFKGQIADPRQGFSKSHPLDLIHTHITYTHKHTSNHTQAHRHTHTQTHTQKHTQ